MTNATVCLASGVEFDPASLLDWNVVAVVGIAAVLGIIGGGARLARLARVERTAIGASLFVAGIASVAAFYVLEPATPLKFVAACLLAGYTGPAVLDALEARFKLEVAQQKAARATQVSQQLADVADKALAASGPKEEGVEQAEQPSLDELRDQLAKLKQELAVIATWPSGGKT